MTTREEYCRRKTLLDVVRRVPLFEGLSFSQTRRFLGSCEYRSYEPGSRICRRNGPSDELYILLSGVLYVVVEKEVRVATVLPVTTVGEMGMITGAPRSATVEVGQRCGMLVVKKGAFDKLLAADVDMRATVFKNIIGMLSAKLSNENLRMRDYQLEESRSVDEETAPMRGRRQTTEKEYRP